MSVFDLPIFYFIPAFFFWATLIIFICIFSVKAIQEIWNKLFPIENKYMYNDETQELGIIKNNKIEIIGKIDYNK